MKRFFDIETARVVETTTRCKISITDNHLREMLKSAGVLVPPGARITFTVPGGGDWSNMAVDIDKEHPIEVEWETREIK